MCRLYGFIANEPTKVDCSLVYAQNALMLQSRVDAAGRDHADGWGVVTYHDRQPNMIKHTTAAFEDQHFSAVAEKIYSSTIVAHIRRATVGEPTLFNTHPFVWRRLTFAHNGTVTGFSKLADELSAETRPELQSLIKGATDSEQYFYWLISRVLPVGQDHLDLVEPDQLERAMIQSVGELEERCREASPDETPRLNFVLTDGSTLIGCRWNHTLYWIERNGVYECEICGIPHIHHHESVNHQAFAIASEPITHDAWTEFENRSVKTIYLPQVVGQD